MTSRARRKDDFDFSNANLTEFPVLPNEFNGNNLIVSNNHIRELPDLSFLTSMKFLDVSHNQLTDIAPISDLKKLQELNISDNLITSIDSLGALTSLEVLTASQNRIRTISVEMPESLLVCDLSFNEIVSLEFVQRRFTGNLSELSFQGNDIKDIMEFRYLAVLSHLSFVNTGFVEKLENMDIVSYLKHVCPTLVSVDNLSCGEWEDPPGFPNEDTLFEVLMNGDSERLYQMLEKSQSPISWDPPGFVDFEEELTGDILERITSDIDKVENRMEIKDEPESSEHLQSLQGEITEIKAQLSALLQVLYVHDKAVQVLRSTRKT